jgi:vancomycin permeability regulator SanA
MTKRSRGKYVWLALGALASFVLLGTLALVVAGLCDDVGKADVALVLGSKVQQDGMPSPRLRARLDKTLELYHGGYFADIIASGGTGKEGYDEAAVMRDYLVAHGIPKEHIIMDSDGTTTFASARNTARIARERKFGSVFVISQYFHLPRARLALRRFGISTIHSTHARFFEARDPYSSPRELFGYLRGCVKSRLWRKNEACTSGGGGVESLGWQKTNPIPVT